MRINIFHTIIILGFWLMGSQAFAQKGYMTIRGKVVLNDKGLQGVNVILLKNGSKENVALTGSSGKYTFNELDISPEGDVYIIKISKPGHISIKHWVSTKAPDDRETIFPDYFPEVELFKKVKEVEKEKALSNILDKPISKFGYSVSKGDFSDDRAYFSTIKARVNQLFEILDAEDRERKRLLAAYKLKQLEEASKQKEQEVVNEEVENVKSSFEIKYEEVLEKGDEAFSQKKYRSAMKEYKAAMSLVSKSRLKKTERDKLKKYPKRKIYDLETLMAGLTDEEIDKLESGVEEEEEVVEMNEEVKEEPENEETEEQVAEEVEEEVVKVLTEEEQAKVNAENSIPNAIVLRDEMMKENMEEIDRQRKEHKEMAAVRTMSSNVEVKEHEVAISIAKKKSEAKVNKNKDVAAQRNLAMVTMLANAKRGVKTDVRRRAVPKESIEERPVPSEARPMASLKAADKDKKNLDRSVVIVHNRIKITSTNAKKKVSDTNKPVSRAKTFKPKSVRFVEESLYKTVTNTVISYPVKQDTLQQVDYRWGTSYYYRNTQEINEAAYIQYMEVLK